MDGFFAPLDMDGVIKSPAGEEEKLQAYANKSRSKTYDLTSEQGNAVLKFIEEQRQLQADGMLRYKLFSSQCATFACDAVRQAGQKPPFGGFGVERPRVLYNSIGKEAGIYTWVDMSRTALPYGAGVEKK